MYNGLCYTSILETHSEPIFVSLYPQLRTIILIDVGFIACLSARTIIIICSVKETILNLCITVYVIRQKSTG